jgi:hypothetical protein
MVLPSVARLSHFGKFVLVLGIDSLEHRSILHHIRHDDEAYFAATDIHVCDDALLAILRDQHHVCESWQPRAVEKNSCNTFHLA